MSQEREPAYYRAQVIDSNRSSYLLHGLETCQHRHRTGQGAAQCGARTIRRHSVCLNTNPENLPAVLGYSVVPGWS